MHNDKSVILIMEYVVVSFVEKSDVQKIFYSTLILFENMPDDILNIKSSK